VSGGGQIGALVKRLEALGTPEFRRGTMAAMAPEVHRLILDGFIGQHDPDGKPWAQRKKVPDWAIKAFSKMQSNHKILDQGLPDGAVESLTVRATATGITVRTKGYMKFHLSGTRSMVPRKWIPTTELGPVWKPALQSIYADRVMGLMR
jgi:hypothetical protein